MRTSRELCSLGEQSSVCKRKREIGIRFPLDNNAAVNPIIADGKVLDVHREVVALAGEVDQSGMAFGVVDQELMTRRLAAGFCRRLTLRDIDSTGHLWT